MAYVIVILMTLPNFAAHILFGAWHGFRDAIDDTSSALREIRSASKPL
jgi:hypothetical protein